jgi:putative tryptophan/tyrosine transport system substrate-binding protein
MLDIRRREFITLLGGGAAGWPLAARAQQGERMRRIGVLLPAAADDPAWQARFGGFLQALAVLGRSIGRNVHVETRWATSNAAEIHRHAAELAALVPDVILAGGTSPVGPLLQTTHTVPIVFTIVDDPVGAGFIDSLARPGGNATGFMAFEFSLNAKIVGAAQADCAERDASGSPSRRKPDLSMSMFAAIQAVAPSLRVEVIPINMRDAGEIEQHVETFARASLNGGLIPMASAAAVRHRDLIVTLAARHKLPSAYWERFFVTAGGLISYGPDLVDQFRQAAGYVDRILNGEKPADLPVQAPTKYELVINLKTAKALGLDALPTLLARADEVI